MNNPETKSQKIGRLQREIAERQLELEFLVLGPNSSPRAKEFACRESVAITPEWRRNLGNL